MNSHHACEKAWFLATPLGGVEFAFLIMFAILVCANGAVGDDIAGHKWAVTVNIYRTGTKAELVAKKGEIFPREVDGTVSATNESMGEYKYTGQEFKSTNELILTKVQIRDVANDGLVYISVESKSPVILRLHPYGTLFDAAKTDQNANCKEIKMAPGHREFVCTLTCP